MVWLPVLNLQGPETLQKNGAAAAKLIPDPRVRFYSDPRDGTGAAYGKLMKVPHGSPAWDIYFVFGMDAQWRNEPPKPQYWMHQLWEMDPKLLLKGPIFFEHVKKLLEQGREAPHELSARAVFCAQDAVPRASTQYKRAPLLE